jgi:hypothetical protein
MKHFPPSLVSVCDAKRRTAWFLITVMIAQLFAPYSASALTGGPSQPEVQSFEPIGTSEMVDVSSGSFTYNVPLMEVGGYPLNLAYHAGATPDEEASVCGLGWNINPGVVNRNMRGLPDDFSGDEVKKEFNIKPNKTWGGSAGFKSELFGRSKKKSPKKSFSLGVNLGMMYNNYKGVGFEFGVMPGFSAGMKGSRTASFDLGLTANSQTGISVSPSMSFEKKKDESEKSSDRGNLNGGITIGTSINSREGMSTLTMKTKVAYDKGSNSAIGKALSSAKNVAQRLGLLSGKSTFSFASPTYSPAPSMPYQNFWLFVSLHG